MPPGLLSLSRRCRTVDRAPTIGTYRQGFWSYEARFILVPARTVREPALDTHEPNSAAEVPGLAFIFYLKPSSRVDRCQMSDVGGRGGRRVGRARCRLVVVGVSCVVQRAGHPTTSKEYICAEAPSRSSRVSVCVCGERCAPVYFVSCASQFSHVTQDKTLTKVTTRQARSVARQ